MKRHVRDLAKFNSDSYVAFYRRYYNARAARSV